MPYERNPTTGRFEWKSPVCEECGEELPKYCREDRRFCSDTCRKRSSRRPKKINKSLENVTYELQQIRRYLKSAKDDQHIEQVNERLKWLRQEITDILRLRDRETIEYEGQKADMIAGLQRRRGNG